MKRALNRAVSVFLLSGIFGTLSYAATHAATTCSSGDVQSAINQSGNGDTVTIPAGNCTWSTSVTVNVGIVLQGSGIGSTTIVDNYRGGAVIAINLVSGQSFRLTGFTLQAGSSLPNSYALAAISVSGGSSSFRLDHITFSGFSNSTTRTVVAADNTFGVIDHNTVSMPGGIFVDVMNSSYLGLGSNGDNSWAQPDSYGSANALYLEDNVFTGTTGGGMAITDSDGNGGRFVVRHNTATQSGVMNHGTESPGRARGGRQIEVYNNTFYNNEALNNTLAFFVQIRSGTGLVFNNTLGVTNTANYPAFTTGVALLLQRSVYNLGGWGPCDGSSPYDENDGTVYASGAYTGSSGGTAMVDNSKSWTTNQWQDGSGYPYSIRNTTQGWGSEITGSNSNTINYSQGGQYSQPNTWNTGDTYQILRAKSCIDQPGRGQSRLLSGSTPSPIGWAGNTLDPVYVFNNDFSKVKFTIGIFGSSSGRMIANRDYYAQTASFDGSSGTGSGPAAARPASCISGVAYWATDQNTLYLCTAPNTWTSSYTPYTYPHPLVSGGSGSSAGSSPSAPAAPTNLTAIVQ